MNFEIFSYRYAAEILQHDKHKKAWEEIEQTLNNVPLYVFPGKSSKNSRLDVVQQLQNTHFDRLFGVELKWDYQPLATEIPESRLTADFRKTFGDVSVQIEVQFGNMARWYSDIFKFQAAYSKSLIQIGVSIVPMAELARRIDSNVVNFERTTRELPAAELSITLPILLIGVSADENTPVYDVSQTSFSGISEITGKGKADNRWRIVNGVIDAKPLADIGEESEVGPSLAEPSDDIE